MLEPKQNNNNFDESELSQLRETVLRWVDIKNNSIQQKTSPKKEMRQKIDIEKKVEEIRPINKKNNRDQNLIIKTEKKIIPPIKYKQPKKARKMLRKITLLISSLIIIIFIILSFSLYILKPTTFQIKQLTKLIPYPIGIINWQPIYYYDWVNQVLSLEKYYDFEKNQNPDLIVLSHQDIEKHILNILIEKELVEQLAKKYNINVSQQELNDQMNSLITEIGGEKNFEKEINNLYNWDIKEFEKEILQPLLLKNKLATAITLDDGLNQNTRKQAEEILQQVKKGDESFEDIAFKQSQDPTALQGGDLGYFSQGQLVPDFEEVAFNLEEGEISDLVKTEFGYHIIKLEDRLLNEDGSISQIRAKHILIRGVTLASQLEEMQKNKLIFTFVNL